MASVRSIKLHACSINNFLCFTQSDVVSVFVRSWTLILLQELLHKARLRARSTKALEFYNHRVFRFVLVR